MLSFVIETDVRVLFSFLLILFAALKSRKMYVVKKSALNFFALFCNHRSCAKAESESSSRARKLSSMDSFQSSGVAYMTIVVSVSER